MKIQLTGQSYEHPSQDANFQRCINFFPSPTGDDKIPATLLHTSGLSELVALPGGSVRALMPFNSKLYTIVDNTVYLVTLSADKESATYSSIGTIHESHDAISWARNPTQIMFVDGTASGYVITAASDTLTQITDPDFLGGTTVDFIDGYFVVSTPNAATMYSSAINDGLSWNALDVATAEGNPDNLLGLIVYKKEIWALGERSAEIWYDAANATGFPFSVRDGALIDLGTSAPHSACRANNNLLWLDDRRFVIMVSGYTPTVVSSPAVSAKFQTYSRVDDAIAFAFKDRGHFFYQITFPTEGKTWCYDLDNKMWHERSYRDSTTDTDTRHLANCYTVFQNLNLVGAFNSGKIYKMSGSYLDDAGDPVIRTRTTSHTTQELKQYSVNSLVLYAGMGQGTVTGTGSGPKISLRYSHDGGHTWSNSLARSLGQIGQYGLVDPWNRLGSGRRWIFELTCADPVPLSLLDFYAEVDGDNNA